MKTLHTNRKIWRWESRVFGIGRDIHFRFLAPGGFSRRQLYAFGGALFLLWWVNPLFLMGQAGSMGRMTQWLAYIITSAYASNAALKWRGDGKPIHLFAYSRLASFVAPVHWYRMRAANPLAVGRQPRRFRIGAIVREACQPNTVAIPAPHDNASARAAGHPVAGNSAAGKRSKSGRKQAKIKEATRDAG